MKRRWLAKSEQLQLVGMTPAVIYLNGALEAGWRLGHIYLCASRLIAAALDRPKRRRLPEDLLRDVVTLRVTSDETRCVEDIRRFQ